MTYHQLDLAAFPRREHYEHFLTMENPFVNMTLELDITDWEAKRKLRSMPFFLSFLYCMGEAANAVPQFRQRLRDGGIVEYDHCDCSYTVAVADGTYRYCDVDTSLPFDEFLPIARSAQKRAEEDAHLTEGADPEGCIYVSSTPWLSFAALEVPHPDRFFSVPSVTIGKYRKEYRLMENEMGEVVPSLRTLLPLSLQVHHALVDGSHLGAFFTELEKRLSEF